MHLYCESLAKTLLANSTIAKTPDGKKNPIDLFLFSPYQTVREDNGQWHNLIECTYRACNEIRKDVILIFQNTQKTKATE